MKKGLQPWSKGHCRSVSFPGPDPSDPAVLGCYWRPSALWPFLAYLNQFTRQCLRPWTHRARSCFLAVLHPFPTRHCLWLCSLLPCGPSSLWRAALVLPPSTQPSLDAAIPIPRSLLWTLKLRSLPFHTFILFIYDFTFHALYELYFMSIISNTIVLYILCNWSQKLPMGSFCSPPFTPQFWRFELETKCYGRNVAGPCPKFT